MPVELWLSIVSAAFALGLLAWYRHAKQTPLSTVQAVDRYSRPTTTGYTEQAVTGLKWTWRGVAVLSVLFLVMSCLQQVGTKEVGVETAFGRTEGELSNGLHVTWPWVNVTEMDGAIQTDTYSDGSDRNKDGRAPTIRIANQQTAYPDVTIRWRIRPDSADYLFQNYRSFENVRDSLVTKELRTALANQLSGYNALNSVQYGTPAQGQHNPTYPELAARVLGQMRARIGDHIEVLSIYMPFVGFDTQTEQKLNQLQQQIAKTRIANQLIQTNEAQATANGKLAHSVDTSPNVLVAQCMTVLQEMVNQNQAVPPGFSCWPGGGLAGVIAAPGTGSGRR